MGVTKKGETCALLDCGVPCGAWLASAAGNWLNLKLSATKLSSCRAVGGGRVCPPQRGTSRGLWPRLQKTLPVHSGPCSRGDGRASRPSQACLPTKITIPHPILSNNHNPVSPSRGPPLLDRPSTLSIASPPSPPAPLLLNGRRVH